MFPSGASPAIGSMSVSATCPVPASSPSPPRATPARACSPTTSAKATTVIAGLTASISWRSANLKATSGLGRRRSRLAGQRQALQMIFGGQAGGWPAQFATLVGEMRGVEFAPITFELADDLAFWRAEVPGRVQARAEALTGPTTPPGQRVQLLNPPGSEVGPGQTATWGRATADRVEAFGFTWEWDGKSSKHIPFDWSGPDPS
jgi:hypothetical protein